MQKHDKESQYDNNKAAAVWTTSYKIVIQIAVQLPANVLFIDGWWHLPNVDIDKG